MFIEYFELWAIVIGGSVIYTALLATVAAIITCSLLGKGKINQENSDSSKPKKDKMRHYMNRTAEFSAILAGIAALGLALSILAGVGLVFGA